MCLDSSPYLFKSTDDREMQDFHHFYTTGEEVQFEIVDAESSREEMFNANKDLLINQFDRIFTGITGFIT